MAFSGYEFIFDGVPSMKYDLMLYDIGSNKQGDTSTFPSAGKLIEDRLSRRLSSLLYGTESNQPLTFNLVFGAHPDRMEKHAAYDRFEIEAIFSWLTGHQTWKWLKIDQQDLEGVRFKCLITEFKQISYGNWNWAFSCAVTCDSPYGRRCTLPSDYVCIDDTTDIIYRNRSSCNEIYYPIMEIDPTGSTEIEIINRSINREPFKFSNISPSIKRIFVDCENKLITANDELNAYQCSNLRFLGFVRGDNQLTVKGKCVLRFICDFPVNVGG